MKADGRNGRQRIVAVARGAARAVFERPRITGSMRTVGARFNDRPAALHALEHVRSRFGVDDAAVAPLADGQPSSTLLAATVAESYREEAVSLIVGDGGEILADVELGAE